MASTEENRFEMETIKRGEAEAEAGPGAAHDTGSSGNMASVEKTSRYRPVSDTLTLTNAPSDDKSETPPPDEEKQLPVETPPEEGRSKDKIAVIMFALGMAVFLAALDVTIITTALPTISEHFHSSAGYTWIGSAYLLGNAASTPSWGKISDIWGRKPILLMANIVFMIGSLIAALSVSIGMLITARAIQGIGGGGLVVLVNICISDLFSMRNRSVYFGVIGMVWALASAVGPLIGGAFTQKVSWRWCFYINLPLDGLAFFIILLFLDLKTPKTPLVDGIKAIDWIGSLTIVGGTLMLLFGLEYGGVSHPWGSATVICLIVFGLVTIGLFVVNEWKFAKYPIMPLRLFKYRSNIAALLVCFCHGFVFIAGSYYMPLYFQAVLGATPLLSGVYLLPFALSLSFASAGTGIFIRKTGKYLPPIWFGMAWMTLGFGLFVDFSATISWPRIILYQIIAGIGIGPNFQAPLIALQTMVRPRDIATATSTFGFTRNLATSISVVIGGVVFQNEMARRAASLRSSLGDAAAAQLSGSSAGANVGVVDALPPAARAAARTAFAASLRSMWILYVAFAGVGLAVSFLIGRQTGLANEREMQADRRVRSCGARTEGPGGHAQNGSR
ncbi:MFS multidrug transporter-like protein [Cryomyces antarcticus]